MVQRRQTVPPALGAFSEVCRHAPAGKGISEDLEGDSHPPLVAWRGAGLHCGLSQHWVGTLSGLAGRGPGRRGGGALRRRAHTLRLARPCPAVHLPSRSGQARGSGRGGRLWPVSSQWGDSGFQGGGPSGDPLLRGGHINWGVPDWGIQRGSCGREGNPFHCPNAKPLVSCRPLPIPTMRRGLFFLQFCTAETFLPAG